MLRHKLVLDMNRLALGQQLLVGHSLVRIQMPLPLFMKPPPMMPMLTVQLERLKVPCPYLPLRVQLAQMMGHQKKQQVNLIREIWIFLICTRW